MLEDENKINLTDLIDVALLQEFQDILGEITGVASITVDDKRAITKPSNFSDLCLKYTACLPAGVIKCVECDIKWGKFAAEKGEPVVYICHAGLTNFAVPIIVGGHHLGSILGGQVFLENPDEEKFRAIARGVGLDENEYIEALKKVKIFPLEHVKTIANLFFIVANAISKLGLKNLELLKTSQREKTYRNIVDTIRSTLDIEETKQKVVDIVGKTLEADRCFIMEYDNVNNVFQIVKDEYVGSPYIPGYSGGNANEDVPNFVSELKKGNYLEIKNQEIYINGEKQEFEPEREAIEKYTVISAYSVPLFYNQELLGVLAVHYLSVNHITNQEELNLLLNVADQVSLALHQAKLYKQTQLNVKREKIIGAIATKATSTFNEEDIINDIVTEIGQFFEADRCFFIEYNQITSSAYLIKDFAEYLSSDSLRSTVGRVFDRIETDVFFDAIKDKTVLTVDDIYRIKLPPETTKMLIDDFSVKSYLVVPVIYEEIMYGAIVLHYVNKFMHFTQEDIDMSRLVANQAASIIYQSKLYKLAQMNMEKEKVIRTILANALSTLDEKEVIKNIVTEMGKLFKSDRCFYTGYDPETDSSLPIQDYAEYLSSDKIKSHMTRIPGKEEVAVFLKLTKQKKIVAVDDINKADLPDASRQMLIDDLGVKSYLVLPVYYGDILCGSMVLHYVNNFKYFTQDEIDMAQLLSDQVASVINRANLYKKTLLSANREALIRTIIENIRSSLDIDEILSFISEETAKLFNVDRSAIAEFPNPKNYEEFIFRKEYKRSPKIKGFKEMDNFSKVAAYWRSNLVDPHQVLAINNIQESKAPQYFKDFYALLGVKSIIGTSIKKGEEVWGTLILAEYNNYRHWSEEEKILLKTIADQIYIAINQAAMYKKERQQVERESLLRKTIEILRSSLNPDQIKQYFVDLAGSYFGADRCLFIDYNQQSNEFLPISVERLKTPTTTSIIGLNVEKELPEFAQRLKIKKNVIIKDLSKLLLKEKLAASKSLNILQKNGVITDYALLVEYKNQIIGILVMHFVEKKKVLTTEEFEFLKILRDQVGTALHQAAMYKIEQEQAKKESLLRKIYEAMRSSLDINIIKNTIVTEIGKVLNADICLIFAYDKENDSFLVDNYSEYRSSEELGSFVDIDTTNPQIKWWIDLFKKKKAVNFSNIEEFFIKNNIEHTSEAQFAREYNLKSGYHLPILYADGLLGYVVLQYIKDYKSLGESDLEFVQTIADQAGIALHQADLFNRTKKQAEREKISANLVEILRNTLDKSTIKHLFVQNIGKYLKADRVFFSEFDEKSGTYLPVDKDSEYLSSDKEKSFVSFQLQGDSSIREYIQPLLEKKELKILSWDEYIKENQESPGFVSRFRDLDVKSSYNMPVLYQQRIIGYFCIEFTQKVFKMSDEDITLIRSICRQAGIALYQAEQYESSQACVRMREETIKQMSDEITSSLSNINELPRILEKCEFSCEREYEYLNQLNENVKQILKMINEVEK